MVLLTARVPRASKPMDELTSSEEDGYGGKKPKLGDGNCGNYFVGFVWGRNLDNAEFTFLNCVTRFQDYPTKK